MFNCSNNVAVCIALNKLEKGINEYVNFQLEKKGFDIRFTHWMVLEVLFQGNNLTQQALADNLYKDKTYITRTVDFLENKKMVKRLSCKKDRRNKYVSLTKEGKNFVEKNQEYIKKDIFCKIFDLLDVAALEDMKNNLNILNAGIIDLLKNKY